MYKYYLFDLDGTLTDPKEGITNSIAYALNKFNIKVEDKNELIKFIGPPLLDSFDVHYGLTGEKGKLALKYYREYFEKGGIFENELYEGVDEMLKTLKARDKVVVLATSKPTKYAEAILEHFKIDGYFDFVSGATMDEKRCKKTDIIEYALTKLDVKDKSQAIMAGDRKHDIIGAREANIASVGVLYGYGSYEELKKENPLYICQKVEDILNIE